MSAASEKGVQRQNTEEEIVMASKSTKMTQFGFILCAIWILGANTAFAGEITGNGKEIANPARSACSYSGLQDDPVGDAGLFRGDRTQNWGQLTEYGLWFFAFVLGITSPSQGCNPNWAGPDPQ
jgi:hypothetical protein